MSLLDINGCSLFMGDQMISNYAVPLTFYHEEEYIDIKPIALNTNAEVEFECSMNYVNDDLFYQLCGSATPSAYTITGSLPIMIQARWHKNPRIRKKWLKRYGMKEDKVKIEMKTNEFTHTPGRFMSVTNYTDFAIDNKVDFTVDEYKYLFRPDQLRRGIKIEFVR